MEEDQELYYPRKAFKHVIVLINALSVLSFMVRSLMEVGQKTGRSLDMSLVIEAALLGLRAAVADTRKNFLRPFHNFAVAVGTTPEPSLKEMVREVDKASTTRVA